MLYHYLNLHVTNNRNHYLNFRHKNNPHDHHLPHNNLLSLHQHTPVPPYNLNPVPENEHIHHLTPSLKNKFVLPHSHRLSHNNLRPLPHQSTPAPPYNLNPVPKNGRMHHHNPSLRNNFDPLSFSKTPNSQYLAPQHTHPSHPTGALATLE